MTAKEYLTTLRWLNMSIKQKQEELGSLRSMAESIGSFDYSKDRVQSSPSGDPPYVKAIEKITDLEIELTNEIKVFAETQHKIIFQLQSLDNPRHADILYRRYVEFKRLEVIAVETGFTYQYVRRLHWRALREFERKFLSPPPQNIPEDSD